MTEISSLPVLRPAVGGEAVKNRTILVAEAHGDP